MSLKSSNAKKSNRSLKRHIVSGTRCPIGSNYYLRLSRLMGQRLEGPMTYDSIF